MGELGATLLKTIVMWNPNFTRGLFTVARPVDGFRPAVSES
jgi:hypothetical protein